MLDSDQIELLSFMEERFWADGHYPSLADCLEFTNFYLGSEATHGVAWIAKTVKSDPFTSACRARGLPSLVQTNPQWTRSNVKLAAKRINGDLPPDPRNRPTLTAEQVLAINVVANLHDRRSISSKLKSINLTTAIWQGWLNSKPFNDYFRGVIARRFNNSDVDAQIALSANIQGGDLQSIKYYHELTGIYRPDSELTRNLNQILANLMEILAKYVSSDVLVRIADEFEGAVSGEPAIVEVKSVEEFLELPEPLVSDGPVGSLSTYSAGRAETNSKEKSMMEFSF